MPDRTCEGACCAVFWLDKGFENKADHIRDGAYIVDMVVPLTREQAEERWAKFVGTDRELPAENPDRPAFTCRHWNEETRLCGAYEGRPAMCRDYPYGQACSHGCSYTIDDPKTAERYGNGNWLWDAEANGWRPQSNAKFTWDAEAGVLRPTA